MRKSAIARMFASMILVWFVGCDDRNANCSASSDTHTEEDSNLVREDDSNGSGGILITDVVLQGSEGGYSTDNRFMCNVHSREDCELWLEVRDAKDGHRYSEIHDESWTRRMVRATGGSASSYDVNVLVPGDGEKVESNVILCGKMISGESSFVLFQTNAVLGTWKGR